jgi:hypothetical protein
MRRSKCKLQTHSGHKLLKPLTAGLTEIEVGVIGGGGLQIHLWLMLDLEWKVIESDLKPQPNIF